MTDACLHRLAALDSCAVSDALDRLGLPGAATGLQALATPRRIVGRTVTVKLVRDDGRASRRHLCTAAVDSADSDSVIVIDHGGRTDAAGWGGILSLAATQRGVAGVVIDGAARDIDESRAFGLTLYGVCGVPVTARGRVVEDDWNVPVTIRDVTVAPGDYVIADGSGVVFVPAARIEEVVAAAETIAARERRMADDVRAGRPVAEVMGKNYETMLEAKA